MSRQLTVEQRYAISVLQQQGLMQKDIAEAINVHKSTISRELSRNKDLRSGKYNHYLAQRKTERRRKERPRRCDFSGEVKELALRLLGEDLSPEQITGRCRAEGKAMVSHETIYRAIWADKKRGGEHFEHLRRHGRKYRHRGAAKDSRGLIKNRVPISERDAVVDLKERFGDLEIDTIIGKNHKGAILTINDRMTSKVWIRRLEGKEAIPLNIKAIDALNPYEKRLHTITSDNGKEFAGHEEIARKLNINFYFCKPYHSWERGANENTNGLIRQYIPKGSSFEHVTDEYIQWIEDKLNNRPRKRLGFLTPNEKLNLIINKIPVAFTS